jgi:GT2 family glycosyltransferase
MNSSERGLSDRHRKLHVNKNPLAPPLSVDYRAPATRIEFDSISTSVARMASYNKLSRSLPNDRSPPELSVDEQLRRMTMKLSHIGVVAIGRNEGGRLIRCLASIKLGGCTVVYVDSGSTDDSIAVAKQFGAFIVRLDLAQPFTAARARNDGFAALKALRPEIRFVQFLDGDCVLVDGWLNKALSFIEGRADAAIVCGRRRERDATASIYNWLCDVEWDTPIGSSLACGGDALVRVEAFEKVGGFRSRLIAGEEPELCVRLRELGWTIWRLDEEMTWHDAAITRFLQWWTRAVRSGFAFAEVSWLHRNSPSGIWRRETSRAIFWGGVLPATICIGILFYPATVVGLFVYFLQICRIAFSRGPTSSQSWIYALFMTLSKFAEFQGVMKFYERRWSRQTAKLIEYK